MAGPAGSPQRNWTAAFRAGSGFRVPRAEFATAAIAAPAPMPTKSSPRSTAAPGRVGNDGGERAGQALAGQQAKALRNDSRCALRAGLSSPSNAGHPEWPQPAGYLDYVIRLV